MFIIKNFKILYNFLRINGKIVCEKNSCVYIYIYIILYYMKRRNNSEKTNYREAGYNLLV